MKASSIRCLVSAGPTREFFDPVRYVTNPSSGKMGYALAEAARDQGWRVDLVSGPVSLPPPPGISLHPVVTGEEMYQAIDRLFDSCDILIMTAAILDYRPRQRSDRKIKKDQLSMIIDMEPVIDVLATVAQRKQPHQLILGFAAETDNLETYALKKLQNKNADLIAANLIGSSEGGFEKEDNTIHLYGHGGFHRKLGPALKSILARALISELDQRLHGIHSSGAGI